MSSDHASSPESRVDALEKAPIGATATIKRILFDEVRAECARLGLKVGQVVRLEGRSDSKLILGSPGGSRTSLERELARFIEVETQVLTPLPPC